MKRFPYFLLLSALATGLTATAAQDPRSAKIDELVGVVLEEKGIPVNASIDDQTFLRRTYLELVGRIPTPEEAEQFNATKGANKRAKLIDQLIGSEGYVSHQFNFWADILRINNRLTQSGADAEHAYRLWLKDSLRENKPYDQFIAELVSARGLIWDNGAVGYYQRDRGMALDNMSNTVRTFLGTRLECAQCHDHPFDKWTQMDYFKMAAFSYGMRAESYGGTENRRLFSEEVNQMTRQAIDQATGIEKFPFQRKEDRFERYIEDKKFPNHLKRYEIADEKEFRKLHAKAEKAHEEAVAMRSKLKRVSTDIYRPIQYISVASTDNRPLKLPHDYQYDDAEPESVVIAGTMFGEEIDLENLGDQALIDAYAEWMTDKDNPTFTRVIANRLWKKVFGIGVFEPVDEITDHTEMTNPRLMNYLEKLMKDLDYDMQEFVSILYKTQTFQREVQREEILAGLPYYFPGPAFKRMSAEQIWDSMVALSIPAVDQYQPTLDDHLGGVEKARRVYHALEDRSPDQFRKMVGEVQKVAFTSYEKQEALRGQLYKAREEEKPDLAKKISNQINDVQREMRKVVAEIAYNGADEKVKGANLIASTGMQPMSMSSMDEMAGESAVMIALPKMPKLEPPADLDKKQLSSWKRNMSSKTRGWRSISKGLMRASEMRSPAPRGHFLREFGQSDREVIENANAGASVPQALNLLNSKTVEILANPFSVLGQTLEASETLDEEIDAIFQAMLTRLASEGEKETLRPLLEANATQGRRDIIWAILNTQQFLFVR